MKKVLLLLTLFSIIGLAIFLKPSENVADGINPTDLPPPTENTIVKMDHEEIPKKKARQAWFDLMHKTPEGMDWKEIEFQNNLVSAKLKGELRNQLEGRSAGDVELVAEGNLTGTWIERGSDNVPGNMSIVNYLVEDDMLFGRSDGGTLWKGDRSGINWEVVNQDFRFQNVLVEARYLANDNIRYIAGLNNQPVYSDDEGLTWTESEGISTSNSARLSHFIEDNQNRMYILQKSHNIEKMTAYRSSDDGTSWEEIFEFSGRNHQDYDLVKVGNSDDILVIEQKDANETRLHMWNEADGLFEVIREESNVGFGPDNDRANLHATFFEDSLRLFVMAPEYVDIAGEATKIYHVYSSVDSARTWTKSTKLPTNPWNVGLHVSSENPKNMMYGEVNSYRSINGGKQWIKNSDWWEYYNDVFGKIHADIMDIREFKDEDGDAFTVVCNHGGISQTFDHGKTFQNIAIVNLNNGQYYSVVTHPTQREWIFAGSQDQGFQRGKITGDGTISMEQVISGDYGHTVFSGPEDKLWTVYPFGSVSYYDQPTVQGPTAGWTLDSQNENVWIPPMLGHPDKSQNAIFLAGGNMNEGEPGSHMIRLDINEFNEIVPSQFDYNFLESNGGTISAMAISPINNDLIFVASTQGHVFKSADAGLTFERMQLGLPDDHYLYGSCLKASLLDENVVYMSGNGYNGPGVYKSIDAGDSYQPMADGLPPTMVFAVAPNEDESMIFAATEAGPYVYITEKNEWFEMSGAITPNQAWWSVEYIPESKTVRFGTYGRGTYDFNVEDQSTATKEELASVSLNIYPNPFADVITINSEIDTDSRITVTDQSGRVYKSQSNKNLKNITLNLSDLTTGIYFVTVKTSSQTITEKIIKQ